MFPSLALAPIAVSCFILFGLLLFAFGELWFLVVAAKRSVLWLIAVLVFQIAGLIILFVEPKSRLPFLVIMLGIGLMVGGYLAAEAAMFANENPVSAIMKPLTGMKSSEGLGWFGDEGTFDERKDRMRMWQKELEAKKAAFKPSDTPAQAAFDQELQSYMQALERLRAEIAAAPKP